MKQDDQPIVFRARKDPGYLILPRSDGASESWEGFVTTNPTSVRLPGDPRVFLGYRACGSGEHYHVGGHGSVWGSLLGLVVLDPSGGQVLHRFPLPIMRLPRDVKLPQDEEEFHAYQKAHGDKAVVTHDFRLFHHDGFLHLVYHQASLTEVDDCIRRMPVNDFLNRIARSIELSARPVEEISDAWRELWWARDAWQPCGVNGSPLLFASRVQKGDNVFIELADGSLQLSHRPCPDNAILNTGRKVCADPTPDGLTTYGTLESCARPGYFDNSHIGPNGNPIPAGIGNVGVYIDVVHGVHNRMLTDETINEWQMTYLPYFRVKDAATGDLLYYSEDPVLLPGETWREYVEHGPWISRLPHLDAVIFTGGQTPVDPERTNVDDEFITYCGIGDSAVAKARFTLRELLPDAVLKDIVERSGHLDWEVPWPDPPDFAFPDRLCGWEWRLSTNKGKRCLCTHRRLDTTHGPEKAERTFLPRPGYFDADGLWFDGHSVRFHEGLGWVVVYQGARWSNDGGQRRTTRGLGLLILHPENPEKVLFRSVHPVEGTLAELEDWVFPQAGTSTGALLDSPREHLPAQVSFEIGRLLELEARGLGFPSQMTKWLKEKSVRNRKAQEECTNA